MSDINPDHYKYMPHSGDETPQPEKPAAEELPAPEVSEVSEISDASEDSEEANLPNEANKPNEDHAPESSRSSEPEITAPRLPEPITSIFYNLLGPLMIPTIATLFIFLLSLLAVVAPLAAAPYALTVFGATCILPLLSIFVLMRIGAIRSWQLNDKTDRIVPYVIEFLALGAMAIFFIIKGASPWIWTIFCGAAAVALVNFAINFRMRISNHCSAIAGLLAVIIVIQTYGLPQNSLFWWVTGTALAAGIIGTLAILKGRHTLWEVLAGYATGFLGIILFSLIH